MTDSISQLGKASVQVNSGADKIKSRSADAAAPQAPDKAIARPGTDEIVLSAVVETALANAEFDATKVARIKEAIEQGATFLVIGRPITQAQDISTALKTFSDSIEK